jgi:UPF0716 family protein affecting phage T7 exclusion
MQKIKVFLVSLTILVLAATFFGGVAMAAQVTRVNESNGRVHINGGEIDGYTLGAIVCFYVSTRETLVCGIVQTASPSTAVVKVEKKWGKRIVKRTEAMLYVEEDEEMKQEDKKEAKEEDKEEMKENEDRFR